MTDKDIPHSSKRQLTFNEILPLIGEYGRYQILLQIILIILIFPNFYQTVIIYFWSSEPMWTCMENSTVCLLNGTFDRSNTSRCLMARSEWKFTDPPDFSIEATYDLYCGNEWHIHLSTSLFYLGYLIGCLVIGWLSDHYGRRMVIVPTYILANLSGCLTALMPTIELFHLCRFLSGTMVSGQVQTFILMSEVVGNNRRALAGLIVSLSLPVAYVALAMQSYFVRNWKILSIITTAPYLGLAVLFLFVVESPRWLTLNGRIDEATKVIEKIAKWNRKSIPSDIVLHAHNYGRRSEEKTKLKLLTERKLISTTLKLACSYFICSLCYFGSTLASSELGGSSYLNFLLGGLVEVPAIFVAAYTGERLGRRVTAWYAALGGSIASFSMAFLPYQGTLKFVRITSGMIARFFFSVWYNISWIWSTEVYPTKVRAECIGIVQFGGKIGGIAMPWIAKYILVFHDSLPYLVMGVSSFVATVLIVLLPETKGVNLEEL